MKIRALLIPALCLLLAGCGSGGDSVASGPAPSSPDQARDFARTGIVFVNQFQPVREVALTSLDGTQTLGSFTTNQAGVFTIPAETTLPAEFLLTTTLTDGTILQRFVSQSRSEYLWVNILSHLMCRYKLAHPELSLEEIEARVRSGLSIPVGFGLYGTGDRSSPFSNRVFLQRAQALGFGPFCEQLIQQIHAGQKQNFAEFPFDQESQGEGFLGFLLHETGSKLFDSTVEFGIGKLTGALGLNIGTAGEFRELNQKLAELSQQIVDLSNQVSQGFLKGAVLIDQSSLNTLIANVNTAQVALNNVANTGASLRAASANPDAFDHGPAVTPSQAGSALSDYAFVVTTNAVTQLTGFLTSSNVNNNLLSLGNKLASAQLGQPNDSGTDYSLRRDDLTVPLETNLALYTGYTQQIASVIGENANANYLPQPLNRGLYAPPSIPINAGLANIVGLAGTLHQARGQVAYDVGSASQPGQAVVLIDAKNGLMWYLPTQTVKYDLAQNNMIDLQVNNWGFPPGTSKPAKVGSSVSKNLNNFSRPANMRGWRLPELSELSALFQYVKAAGGGKGSKAAMQSLGFQGLEDDHDNFKKWWYNGAVRYFTDGTAEGNEPYTHFYYFDMTNGSETFGEGTNHLHFDADPLYTAAWVRSIRGLDTSTNFGDTGAQLHLGYSNHPSQLNLLDLSGSNPHTGADIRTFALQGQDNTQVSSDLGAASTFTLVNPSSSGVAFLNYNRETSGARRFLTEVVFRRPGTVTLKATTPVGDSQSITLTSNQNPLLQSIQISPQNYALTSRPVSGSSQQFYCTGYIGTGETIDLTPTVDWSISSSQGSGTPMSIFSHGPTPGILIFGDSSALQALNTVQANYRHGSLTGQDWIDNGRDFQDSSIFSAPVP
jgi:hypothetical protein